MQSTGPNVLAVLKALAQDNPRIDVLWLYGSRAKATAGPESDYDLAVAFHAFPEDPWERRLQPELLAMEWADALGLDSDRLSVVDINHVPLTLAHAITTTARVLLAKDRLRLAREEHRVSSMWEIDHQHHKRHYG